jgi:general secretion pathway protein E
MSEGGSVQFQGVVAAMAQFARVPPPSVQKIYDAVHGNEIEFLKRVVECGLAPEADAYDVGARAMGIDFENPDVVDLDLALLSLVPVEALRRYQVVPLRWVDDTMVAAMVNPMDLLAIDGFQEAVGAPVLPVLCTPRFLQEAIRFRERADKGIEGLLTRFDLEDVDSAFANPQRLREIAGDDAIVQLVDYIVDQALRRRVSDIHVEVGLDLLRVRYRIDGRLETVQRLPKALHGAIVTRVKILANLDLAERRRPQDGRFRRETAPKRRVEFRVSTLPASHGEKVVLRVLDKASVSLDLRVQGFSPALADTVLHAASAANGIVLVTGPTGSGKTTTLYGVLSYLNTEDVNVITVEDPVEYELAGITQVQVDPKAERTFASTLRAMLRQDPDVIMVGEIRDRETAEIAVHAALTGHMVLSTLHTNSALGTLTRLIDMGMEPYLLAPTIRAIVAQRLVRKLCPSCKKSVDPPALWRTMAVAVDKPAFKAPVGCPNCRHTGFQGRVPIHEVLSWNDHLASLLSRGCAEQQMAEAAREQGFEPLLADGARKAAAGSTTLEEVMSAART